MSTTVSKQLDYVRLHALTRLETLRKGVLPSYQGPMARAILAACDTNHIDCQDLKAYGFTRPAIADLGMVM